MSDRPLFKRGLWVLFGVSLIAGGSMGFFAPLLSQTLRGLGQGDLAIGVVSTAYYLFVAGAPNVMRFGRKWGAHWAMSAGLCVAAVSTASTPICHSLVALTVARALAGLGTGVYMAAAQATLGTLADEANRAKIMGIHGTAFAVGLILGAVSGPALYAHSVWFAFLSAGAMLLAGAVMVLVRAPRVGMRLDVSSASVRRRASLALHAVFAYGFAESALLSLYPAFLLWKGASFSTTGLACSAFVWGGAISTIPSAAVGDRYGRIAALIGCTVIGCGAAALLARANGASAVLIGSMLVGAGFGPVYSLALAIMGDALETAELTAGSAAFTASFAIGCIAGPMLTAASMYLFGTGTVFIPTIAVFATVFFRCLSPRPAQMPPPMVALSGSEER